MSSRKRECKSQMWCGSSLSRKYSLSSRVKKALQLRAKCRPVSSQSRSILVLCVDLSTLSGGNKHARNRTYVPHINEARFGPRYKIIHVHKSTFSAPLSPRTRDGHPNSLMAWRNSLRTVWAVLLDETRIPVILGVGQATSQLLSSVVQLFQLTTLS